MLVVNGVPRLYREVNLEYKQKKKNENYKKKFTLYLLYINIIVEKN